MSTVTAVSSKTNTITPPSPVAKAKQVKKQAVPVVPIKHVKTTPTTQKSIPLKKSTKPKQAFSLKKAMDSVPTWLKLGAGWLGIATIATATMQTHPSKAGKKLTEAAEHSARKRATATARKQQKSSDDFSKIWDEFWRDLNDPNFWKTEASSRSKGDSTRSTYYTGHYTYYNHSDHYTYGRQRANNARQSYQNAYNQHDGRSKSQSSHNNANAQASGTSSAHGASNPKPPSSYTHFPDCHFTPDCTNPYQILEVTSTSSPKMVKSAKNKLLRKYHPDSNDQNNKSLIRECTEITAKINNAFDRWVKSHQK